MPRLPTRRQDHYRPGPALRMVLATLLLCLLTAGRCADDLPVVRVAVLNFGTAAWELDTIRRHGLDRQHGFKLQVLPLAGKQATMVALQAGNADLAVTDWLWVSRQRAAGRSFSFIPYSSATGALVVPEASPIRSVRDLAGKRVGVAGGPLDKSWLLLRALALQEGEPDPADSATPVFGAPPLLSQQLEQGRIDAVVTFWPYVARLRAKGMRAVVSTREAADRLGLDSDLPLVGYVFDEDWAKADPERVADLTAALAEARRLLAESDTEWDQLRPLMHAENETVFEALRDGWRAGIPRPMDPASVASAARLLALLERLGGPELVGPAGGLSPGTFWGVEGG